MLAFVLASVLGLLIPSSCIWMGAGQSRPLHMASCCSGTLREEGKDVKLVSSKGCVLTVNFAVGCGEEAMNAAREQAYGLLS